MGLLDDAIREHLDLKRRRGADPTEVEQAEREALGPVRRDPFEHAEDEPEAAIAGGEPEGAYDQAAESEYEEYELESIPEAPALPEDRRMEPLAEEEPFDAEEPFGAEEPFADERPYVAPHPAEAAVGEETAEYDVEGTFAEEHPAPSEQSEPHEPPVHEPPAHGEAPAGDEDVLEETPEFLQDAPEHDRLWFEQRPPKDFDFDG